MISVSKAVSIGMTATLTMAVLFLVACAKSPANAPAPAATSQSSQQPTGEEFKAKSASEILQLKYNKAVLNCQLWSQHATELRKDKAPNATFSWDLLNSPDEKSFSLQSESADQDMRFLLSIEKMEILSQAQVRPLDGKIYDMRFSPVISFKYTYQERHGQALAKGEGANTINERVPDHSFDSAVQNAGAGEKYLNVVDCLLDTEAKPQYQEQFSITESK